MLAWSCHYGINMDSIKFSSYDEHSSGSSTKCHHIPVTVPYIITQKYKQSATSSWLVKQAIYVLVYLTMMNGQLTHMNASISFGHQMTSNSRIQAGANAYLVSSWSSRITNELRSQGPLVIRSYGSMSMGMDCYLHLPNCMKDETGKDEARLWGCQLGQEPFTVDFLNKIQNKHMVMCPRLPEITPGSERYATTVTMNKVY